MSGSDGGGPGRREVAVRCFAAEYEDAEFEYSESDEERAPNYVVTPTGARINRLFVVGVLTEVEAVSDDVLRGRVVDPTGAFVIYAGQYQPDAKTFLERADPPQFVAVTGKARTFQPDDGDRVFTSIRPESINAVDAGTRDRWTVQTAEHTVERVATAAAALEREERGDDLEAALRGSGADPALAAGIPRAIDHYGTTPAYLAAVRDLAMGAAEVVAGERDEVEPLERSPDEGGAVDADLTGDVVVEATAPAAGSGGSDAAAETETTVAETAASEDETPAATASTPDADETGSASEGTTGEEVETAGAGSESAGDDELGDFEPSGADEPDEGAVVDEAPVDETGAEEPEGEAPDVDETAEAGAQEADVDTDELYEVDEAEREAIEEEYGTDFSTGGEVGEPGEADIETPGAVEDEEPEDVEATDAEAGSEAGVEEAESEATVDEEPDEPESETDAEEASAAADEGDGAAESEADEVDLEDAVVEAMESLDEGDGADRATVVESVADETGADPDDVEDAIDDALMGGRCYEPEDGRLKAI